MRITEIHWFRASHHTELPQDCATYLVYVQNNLENFSDTIFPFAVSMSVTHRFLAFPKTHPTP